MPSGYSRELVPCCLFLRGWQFFLFVTCLYLSVGQLVIVGPLSVVTGCCPMNSRTCQVLIVRDEDITSGTLTVTQVRPRVGLSLAFMRRTTVLRSVNVFHYGTPSVSYRKSTRCVYRNCLKTRLVQTRNCPHRTHIYRQRAKANVALTVVRRQNLPLPRQSFVPRALRRRLVYCTSGFCDGAGLSGRGSIRGMGRNLSGCKGRAIRQFSG